MRRTSLGGFLLKLVLAVAFLLSGSSLAAEPAQIDEAAVAAANKDTQAQRQQDQPYNNAPIWRDVRSGQENYTTVKGVETGVLVQSAARHGALSATARSRSMVAGC
jgi:formate dehydrogenase subunit gamma